MKRNRSIQKCLKPTEYLKLVSETKRRKIRSIFRENKHQKKKEKKRGIQRQQIATGSRYTISFVLLLLQQNLRDKATKISNEERERNLREREQKKREGERESLLFFRFSLKKQRNYIFIDEKQSEFLERERFRIGKDCYFRKRECGDHFEREVKFY